MKTTVAEFSRQMREAKTPQARADVAMEFESAVKGGRIVASVEPASFSEPPATTGALAEFERRFRQAKTPQARADVAKEFESAVKEDRLG